MRYTSEIQTSIHTEQTGISSTSEKKHKKNVKRGKRKSRRKLIINNKNIKNMTLIGANTAGLLNKIQSLKSLISRFEPAVILLQETKVRSKNKLKLDNYFVYEHIRTESGGGGLLTAVHKSLEPVEITNIEDGEEILTVEAIINNKKVRFINDYGPQETASEDNRKAFFNFLDLEVRKAKTARSLVCIEMDSNAKLGSKLIPLDPKPQSANGMLLAQVLENNNLTVVNDFSNIIMECIFNCRIFEDIKNIMTTTSTKKVSSFKLAFRLFILC